MQRQPFGIDEWYHCYARGIEKRKTFECRADYERFIGLLYLCNSDKSRQRSNFRNPSLLDILAVKRGKPLVAVGAFALMPNHFHLLLKEIADGGISAFMQKLGTAYTMYFNIKNERTGGLFAKPFHSRHIVDDRYFQYVIQYIHFNPAELFAPRWKEGYVPDIESLEKKLIEYPYSSFGAYQNKAALLRRILDESIFEIEMQSTPQKILKEAQMYYADCVKATP